jgi:DNA-binding MarR family transcriptional regulator
VPAANRSKPVPRPRKSKAAHVHLPGGAGGPLSRELTIVRVLRLAELVNRSASRAYPRVSGLSDFEWRVVALVRETPRQSINDLAARLNRGVAQVSRTVKKLVAAGLLHRANRTGGPGVLITVTRLGRTVHAPLEVLARARNAAIIAGLGVTELSILDHCIAVMTANAIAQLAQEQRFATDFDDAAP